MGRGRSAEAEREMVIVGKSKTRLGMCWELGGKVGADGPSAVLPGYIEFVMGRKIIIRNK